VYNPPSHRVDDPREALSMVERAGFGHLVSLQWKRIDRSDVFVLIALTDGYVSPNWYPSKAKDGKVVPT